MPILSINILSLSLSLSFTHWLVMSHITSDGLYAGLTMRSNSMVVTGSTSEKGKRDWCQRVQKYEDGIERWRGKRICGNTTCREIQAVKGKWNVRERGWTVGKKSIVDVYTNWEYHIFVHEKNFWEQLLSCYIRQICFKNVPHGVFLLWPRQKAWRRSSVLLFKRDLL